MATTNTKVDPYNQIAYLKNQYEQAKSSGNTAGMNYAHTQAQTYYDQLAKQGGVDVNALKGMNAQQVKSKYSPTPITGTGALAGNNTSQGWTGDKIGDTNYSPITYGANPAPLGVTDIGSVNKYAGIDMNKVLEYNKTIMDAKANYLKDPVGSAKAGAEARKALSDMGLDSSWIIGNDSSDPNEAWKRIQQQAADASKLPNETTSNYLMDMFNQLMSGSNIDQNALMAAAKAQADQQLSGQRDQYNNLIKSLKDQQKAGLMGIDNNVKDSQQSLEDKSFQDYLAARQEMANRGLAGSGIASDQDTRLLLSKQRDLAGIMRDAEQQKFSLNSQYGDQIDGINKQLASLDSNGLTQQLFQQLLGNAQKSNSDKASQFADMFKSVLGYELPNAGDLLKNQSDQSKQAQDALASAGYVNINGKLVPTMEAVKESNKYSMDLSNATGYLYGADGKPVLGSDGKPIKLTDRERLDEQVRHDQASEGISQQNANTNATNAETNQKKLIAQMNQWTEQNKIAVEGNKIKRETLDHRIQVDEETINQARSSSKLTDTQKAALDVLKTRLGNITSRMNSAQSSINGDGTVPKELTDDYNNVLSQMQKILNNVNFNSGGSSSSGNGPSVNVPQPYAGMIAQSENKYGLPSGFLGKIAKAESSFNPNARNSKSGASGMFQFMPATAKGYGIDPFDPKQASDAAGKMMSGLIAKYNGDVSKALAGYNWGGGNVDKAVRKYGDNWLAHAPAETQKYIKKILG